MVMITRPSHRQQYRTAPFSAYPDPLDHAQNGQDHCAPNDDRLVRGNKGDRKGGASHEQKRSDQRRLASDAVALMAEYCSADRPTNKTDEVGTESCQRPG